MFPFLIDSIEHVFNSPLSWTQVRFPFLIDSIEPGGRRGRAYEAYKVSIPHRFDWTVYIFDIELIKELFPFLIDSIELDYVIRGRDLEIMFPFLIDSIEQI